MLSLIENINFWSAISGFIGTIIIFFFGLPPHINPHGEGHLLLQGTDKKEAKKYKIFKLLSYIGLSLIALSFLLEIVPLIPMIKKKDPQSITITHFNLNQYPNKLIISKLNSTQDNQPIFFKRIIDENKVKSLYEEMNSLPKPASGTFNCPADFFVRYYFDFYNDENLLLHAIVDPTGCRIIQFYTLKESKWIIGQVEFNTNLKQIIDQ